ncbi:MAG: hypothetical protein R2864_06065 [Syntrophotaleaceae bacterium]
MEGEPLKASIAGTVFSITDDGMPQVGKMHSDLVFATGQELYIHQTEPFGLFRHLVGRMGKLAFAKIMGRINPLRGILDQAGGDRSLLGTQYPMNNGQIVFIGLGPILLQKLLGLFALANSKIPEVS